MVGAINDSVDKLHSLVDQARETEAFKVLGYPTLGAYLADVFVIPARLDRSTRADVVGFLSDQVGMSQRQIGNVIGVDQKTVGNDLRDRRGAAEPAGEPELAGIIDDPSEIASIVAMTDGVSDEQLEAVLADARAEGDLSRENVAAKCKSRVADSESEEFSSLVTRGRTTSSEGKRRPLIEKARKLSLELPPMLRRIDQLLDDDRFAHNRENIACALRPYDGLGLKTLGRLNAEITPPSPDEVLPMIVHSLETVVAGCHAGRPDLAVAEAERMQHIATIRDYLDAIHDALEQWETTL